jgi:undecaprenyl-diphosphatase
VLAAVVLLLAGYVLAVNLQGNFHPITPGEAYRSGQPDDHMLAQYKEQYKIKSVLNLRGSHPGESWYEEELAASTRLNLVHYDVSLSASSELKDAEVRQLMDIFRTAPRPILIHCQAGADRSGLVAAMWKVAVNKMPKAEARKQLSLWYGHLAVGEKRAMDSFFEKWNPEYQESEVGRQESEVKVRNKE